jgi:hypothetical protein
VQTLSHLEQQQGGEEEVRDGKAADGSQMPCVRRRECQDAAPAQQAGLAHKAKCEAPRSPQQEARRQAGCKAELQLFQPTESVS